MFQEMHQTHLADLRMSKDSFNVTISLEREYEKPDYKLLEQHEDDGTDELDSDQVVVNPK